MTRMSQPWRYVDCGAVDAFENSAQLPVLVRSVAETLQPTLMTSVWGATHLNVGWFDDVDSTLDLGRCDALGVQVVRRAVYGGGTAFYSSGCAAMWTFLVPKDAASNLDAELARFQPIVLDALAELDLGDMLASRDRVTFAGMVASLERYQLKMLSCATALAVS